MQKIPDPQLARSEFPAGEGGAESSRFETLPSAPVVAAHPHSSNGARLGSRGPDIKTVDNVARRNGNVATKKSYFHIVTAINPA